ncbi:TPA: cobalamin biosynthesis protein [Escherichia coli]|uniref:cobalamin biosynthesis protein n=1 Tax=Escherichia coli TaxID=562 RepID=UPI00235A376F|nr:cobalamin biosynthesis protein [Escherichia coli]MDF1287898.1 cobalamin biosynthesis protein [Escherichia coli]
MHYRGCGFIREDWQQDFQPLNGGSVQSLSDAYSDYSVQLLIAAESEISVPEWLPHSEGTRVILIAERNARLLTGPAGGTVALIHYLNEICHSRETAVNDAFCHTLTRGSRAIPQCHLLS